MQESAGTLRGMQGMQGMAYSAKSAAAEGTLEGQLEILESATLRVEAFVTEAHARLENLLLPPAPSLNEAPDRVAPLETLPPFVDRLRSTRMRLDVAIQRGNDILARLRL